MTFLRKHLFFLFLLFLAVLLGSLWFWGRVKKGQYTPLPSLPKISFPDISGQSLAGVEIVFGDLTLPSTVPLYQISPRRATDLEIASLVQNFNFPEKPSNVSRDSILGEYRLWLSTTHSLSVRVSPFEVSISQNAELPSAPANGTLPDPHASSDYLKRIITTNKLEVSGVVFQDGDSRKVNNGDVLQTQLQATVEGVEVVDVNPYVSLISAGLKKDRGLFYFSYRAGFTSPTNKILYPAKGEADVKRSLLTEGKIMAIGDPFSSGPVESQLLTPRRIEITSVKSMLLFFPERSTFLFPIYVLQGVVYIDGTGEKPVVIYLPSVKSGYLQKANISSTP